MPARPLRAATSCRRASLASTFACMISFSRSSGIVMQLEREGGREGGGEEGGMKSGRRGRRRGEITQASCILLFVADIDGEVATSDNLWVAAGLPESVQRVH